MIKHSFKMQPTSNETVTTEMCWLIPEKDKLVRDFDVVSCFNQKSKEGEAICYLFSSEDKVINVYGLVPPDDLINAKLHPI
jgi:hypothetical protein